MSATFMLPPELARTLPVTDLPRKRWTRDEVEFLESHHVFDGQCYELIDGELFNRMGMKRPHSLALMLVSAALIEWFGAEFVQSQVPIDVSPEDNPSSEPQPDVFVLYRNGREITQWNPRPADIALIVEVADSSLILDLTIKAALYARAAIADYWVLDLNARRLIVHREPHAGSYRSVVAYEATESIAPLARPEAAIALHTLLS